MPLALDTQLCNAQPRVPRDWVACLPAPHASLQRAHGGQLLPEAPPLLVPAHGRLHAQRRRVRAPQLCAAPPRQPAARACLNAHVRVNY